MHVVTLLANWFKLSVPQTIISNKALHIGQCHKQTRIPEVEGWTDG